VAGLTAPVSTELVWCPVAILTTPARRPVAQCTAFGTAAGIAVDRAGPLSVAFASPIGSGVGVPRAFPALGAAREIAIFRGGACYGFARPTRVEIPRRAARVAIIGTVHCTHR